MRSLIIILCVFLMCDDVGALERCKKYAHDVKRFHAYYFGIDFPYHDSVAQLQKESLCKNNILSSDGIGSEGPAQITFRVWHNALQKEGIPEIKTISNHLKAQAFINRQAYDQAVCKQLWVMYQTYNGGPLVNKEIRRAGSCDWQKAYAVCQRKVIVFNNGQRRNACDINYEYSRKIYDIGQQYKTFESGTFPFW